MSGYIIPSELRLIDCHCRNESLLLSEITLVAAEVQPRLFYAFCGDEPLVGFFAPASITETAAGVEVPGDYLILRFGSQPITCVSIRGGSPGRVRKNFEMEEVTIANFLCRHFQFCIALFGAQSPTNQLRSEM